MISIIVPVYNVEKYLPKCIESICRQTYTDLEIILVDDGSPDESGRICEEYAAKDKRIKVIHKQNGGLSDARNAGLDIAKGDYIQFVDSDDYIHPKMTEILYRNLTDYQADVSICNFVVQGEEAGPASMDKDSMEQTIECFEGREVMDQLQKKNTVTVIAWNKLYKASLFENLRYEKGRLHEDEYLIHHLLDRVNVSVYTDAELYYYVQHAGSITGKVNSKRVKDAYEAYLERLAFMKQKEYAYMELCTKKHILYHIFRYYRFLGKTDLELKKQMRESFKMIMEEPGMEAKLPTDLRADYRIFMKSPEFFYHSRGMVHFWRSTKKNTKKILRKVLKRK